ncbi:MAG: DUF1653 domain-containing protein, partial [Candidatus Binataceae bacterium]
KGGLYQVLGIAGSSDEATEGQLMVVYVCLYTDKGGPYMRVRSLTEFEAFVRWPDGSLQSRFVYQGETT